MWGIRTANLAHIWTTIREVCGQLKQLIKGKLMKEIVLALVAGIIFGLAFRLLKLPLPAPPVLAGVMGIVGVYLGSKLFDILKVFYFNHWS